MGCGLGGGFVCCGLSGGFGGMEQVGVWMAWVRWWLWTVWIRWWLHSGLNGGGQRLVVEISVGLIYCNFFFSMGLILGWVLIWVFSMGLILGDYNGF